MSELTKKNASEVIKQLRLKLQISQRAFAELSNKQNMTISNMENKGTFSISTFFDSLNLLNKKGYKQSHIIKYMMDENYTLHNSIDNKQIYSNEINDILNKIELIKKETNVELEKANNIMKLYFT